MNKIKNIFTPLLLPILLLVIWEYYSNTKSAPIYLPPFHEILEKLIELLTSPEYWLQIGTTTYRFMFGFMISALLAVPIGLILGRSKEIYKYFQFIIEFFRPLPSASIIPISILFLGIEDSMKLFVIVFASFWPILINTIDGVRNIEPQYVKTAKAFNIDEFKILTRIVLPLSMPQIFSGLKISLAISLILAITVEMIVGGDGIGNFILEAERSFQFSDMYAGVITIGLLGYSVNIFLNRIEKWIIYWK